MLNNDAFKIPWLFFPLMFLASVLDAEEMRRVSEDTRANDIMFLDPDPVTIKNKLRYLHQLSHVSPLIKRVQNSSCQDAQLLLKSAIDAHVKGQQELEQDNLESALEYADQGLRDMAAVARILPDKVREKKVGEVRFEELHTHVAGLKKTLSRIEGKSANDTRTELDELINKSKQLAEAGDYQLANDQLASVSSQLEKALNDAYDTDTLVYELDFDTPEEEYQYENRRNKEYIKLAEVLEQQGIVSDSGGRFVVINKSKEKNAELRSEAEMLAKNGRFELATKRMEDASRVLTNALRSVGLAVQ